MQLMVLSVLTVLMVCLSISVECVQSIYAFVEATNFLALSWSKLSSPFVITAYLPSFHTEAVFRNYPRIG